MRVLRFAAVAVVVAVGWCVWAGQAFASVCASGPTQRGVDVSIFQGTIDWPTVAASGISFGYARVADGTNPDPTFQQNFQGMQWAGVQRGAYLFFEPNQDPVAQADTLISALLFNGYGPGDLPPIFDVEVTGGIMSAAQIAASLQVALDRVQSVLGVTPGIYTGPGWWNGNIGSTAFGRYPLWVANWGVTCPTVPMGWSTWQIWQYADNGHIGGIPATVDLDQMVVPVVSRPTTIAFTATSATSGDFHDPVAVQARLTDADGPVAGAVVTFALTGPLQPSCTAMTDGNGVATCPDFIPYVGHRIAAEFDGRGVDAASGAVEPFTITPEEATLTYTGMHGPLLAGSTAILSARLLEDGTTPISGVGVDLGLPGQPCLDTITTTGKDGSTTTTTGPYGTDASGVVTCVLTVNQPLGPTQITASFNGGGSGVEWVPVSDSASALVYAYPTQGVPVLRTAEAAPHSWWLATTTAQPPSCGATWTAQADGSLHQTDTLPAYMGYVVPGPVTRNANTFSGTITHIRIEDTATGKTIATAC